jgi:hypothetical protein
LLCLLAWPIFSSLDLLAWPIFSSLDLLTPPILSSSVHRASPIPRNHKDHSLDSNQGNLSHQYVTPWEVELRPNPINPVIETYSLHHDYATPLGSKSRPVQPIIASNTNNSPEYPVHRKVPIHAIIAFMETAYGLIALFSSSTIFTTLSKAASTLLSSNSSQTSDGSSPSPPKDSQSYNPFSAPDCTPATTPSEENWELSGPPQHPHDQSSQFAQSRTPTLQDRHVCHACNVVYGKQHELKFVVKAFSAK